MSRLVSKVDPSDGLKRLCAKNGVLVTDAGGAPCACGSTPEECVFYRYRRCGNPCDTAPAEIFIQKGKGVSEGVAFPPSSITVGGPSGVGLCYQIVDGFLYGPCVGGVPVPPAQQCLPSPAYFADPDQQFNAPGCCFVATPPCPCPDGCIGVGVADTPGGSLTVHPYCWATNSGACIGNTFVHTHTTSIVDGRTDTSVPGCLQGRQIDWIYQAVVTNGVVDSVFFERTTTSGAVIGISGCNRSNETTVVDDGNNTGFQTDNPLYLRAFRPADFPSIPDDGMCSGSVVSQTQTANANCFAVNPNALASETVREWSYLSDGLSSTYNGTQVVITYDPCSDPSLLFRTITNGVTTASSGSVVADPCEQPGFVPACVEGQAYQQSLAMLRSGNINDAARIMMDDARATVRRRQSLRHSLARRILVAPARFINPEDLL